MPASGLLEDMQNRGGRRVSLRNRHGAFSPHIAITGARLQTPLFLVYRYFAAPQYIDRGKNVK
jgi:hypothetical protein